MKRPVFTGPVLPKKRVARPARAIGNRTVDPWRHGPRFYVGGGVPGGRSRAAGRKLRHAPRRYGKDSTRIDPAARRPRNRRRLSAVRLFFSFVLSSHWSSAYGAGPGAGGPGAPATQRQATRCRRRARPTLVCLPGGAEPNLPPAPAAVQFGPSRGRDQYTRSICQQNTGAANVHCGWLG